MATWTDPTSLATAVDDPVTTALATALKNNPVALAEGASGAPRIVDTAMQAYTAGNNVIGDALIGVQSTTSTSFVGVPNQLVAARAGTVRVFVNIVGENGAQVRYRVNGSNVVTSSTVNSVTYVSRTADIAVVAGDVVSIQFKAGTGTASVKNLRLLCGFYIGVVTVEEAP